MKRPIKSEALRLVAASLSRLSLTNTARFRILTFHSVQDHQDDRWHTPPKIFESQMRYLFDSGYITIRISDIGTKWPDILKSEKAVALAFDDGLLNNYTIVCDILSRFNMTATFFVTTENIRNQRTYPISSGLKYFRDTLMLSWNDIRSMSQSGFEIGSHSHSHDFVAKLSKTAAFENIATSKHMIEEELEAKITSFAYPYGRRDSYSGWTKEILMELGFRVGCTQRGGALSEDDDLLELPRIGIKGSDSLEIFKQKVVGCYDFLRWF